MNSSTGGRGAVAGMVAVAGGVLWVVLACAAPASVVALDGAPGPVVTPIGGSPSVPGGSGTGGRGPCPQQDDGGGGQMIHTCRPD